MSAVISYRRVGIKIACIYSPAVLDVRSPEAAAQAAAQSAGRQPEARVTGLRALGKLLGRMVSLPFYLLELSSRIPGSRPRLHSRASSVVSSSLTLLPLHITFFTQISLCHLLKDPCDCI